MISIQAKLLGQSEVSLGSGSSLGIVESSLESASEHFSVLIVEPYAKQTVSADGGLSTWFKCHLVEALSLVLHPPLPWAPKLATLPYEVQPSALLPLSAEDIFLLIRGGKISIDNVDITFQPEQAPLLDLGERYLVLATISEDRTVARIPLQAAGVFVTRDGHLTSLSRSREQLGDEMDRVYQGELQSFRTQMLAKRLN